MTSEMKLASFTDRHIVSEMKLTALTDRYIVLDNCLPPSVHHDVWVNVCQEDLFTANISREWSPTWRVDGQAPASSPSYQKSKGGYQNYALVAEQLFLGLVKHFDKLFAGLEWKDLRIHSHIATRGTKLNWHTDRHGYCAFTYYAHMSWGSTWGGELFIPEAPTLEEKPPRIYDSKYWDSYLANGFGTYITPKPNRCVLVFPGVVHSFARIDPDAGDAVRVSIVGFLQ